MYNSDVLEIVCVGRQESICSIYSRKSANFCILQKSWNRRKFCNFRRCFLDNRSMPRRLKDELERLMDCVVSTFTSHIETKRGHKRSWVGDCCRTSSEGSRGGQERKLCTMSATENHLKTGGEALKFQNTVEMTNRVNPECLETFKQLKIRRKHRYILFKLVRVRSV